MNIKEKRFIAVAAALALAFGITPVANAMHIMEGYLPPTFSIIWGAICTEKLSLKHL